MFFFIWLVFLNGKGCSSLPVKCRYKCWFVSVTARYRVKMVTVNSAVWRFCPNHRAITWNLMNAVYHGTTDSGIFGGFRFQSAICFVSSRSWKDVNWNKLKLWYFCTMLDSVTFSQQYASFSSCENDLISSDIYFLIIKEALISLGRLLVCRVTCSGFYVCHSLKFLSHYTNTHISSTYRAEIVILH